DGSQAGTLGGGCVEAEVKRQALAVLQSGQAAVTRFQLDDDYGWDDGLICGGRMQVLVDPLATERERAYFSRLRELGGRGEGATEAIVYDASASGLPEAACYLFDAEGHVIDQLRGPVALGGAPEAVLDGLRPLAERPRPSAARGIAYL